MIEVGIMKAEDAAKSLTTGISTVAELDAALAALPVNAGKENVTSFVSEDVSYSNLYTGYAEWMADSSRKSGDMTYVPSTTTTVDANGNEVEQIIGFYVVMFNSSNDNTYPLANVRHILAAYEGGTTDSSTGVTTYTDEEKAAAKAAAEEIYNEWKNGAATEENFAQLANEKSAAGNGTTGGLYENVYPGQMVGAFEDWCFDDRKVGDTGIVETEYGYHVMYYCGDSETTYRDYLITNDLTKADYSAWYTALLEAVTATEDNTKYISTDLIIGG